MSSSVPVKETRIGPPGETYAWSPINARWIGNDRIEFLKATQENTTWDEGGRKSTGQRQIYILEGGKWNLQAASGGRK